MATAICGIPLSHIRRVEIYINKSARNLEEVKEATGADYVINGGLFEGSRAVCHLKAGRRPILRGGSWRGHKKNRPALAAVIAY